MNWVFVHETVDRLDRSLPTSLKKGIKRVAGPAVDRFYYAITKASPAQPQDVVVQGGPLAGRRLHCSLRDRSYFLGNYEPGTAAALALSLREGDTYLDIGGHVGYMALAGAVSVGASGRVITFEPNSANRALIGRSLALNPDIAPRVTVEALAVCDRVGRASFVGSENSPSGHLSDSEAGTLVDTTTIDGYVLANGLRPRLIKMDIEGGERLALPSAVETIRRTSPILLVETHDAASHDVFWQLMDRFEYIVSPSLRTWPGRPGQFLGTPR